MFKKLLTALLLTVFFFPYNVLACACCAEPGDHFEYESELKEFEINVLSDIGLASSTLFTDAGYPETIKGIDPLGESFSVTGSLQGNVFKLEFTDDKARKAALNLWRPKKIETFGVDQDPLKKERGMVVLYKELRLKYRVQSATGFLENGIDADTEYKLILQGRGNGCLDASNFDTYILQIKGNKARYSFFGKLMGGAGKVMQSTAEDRGLSIAN
ncbi:MAG: hypothetical protein HKN33_16385 [Pyrinomonadaceae bacterium]|nr:hypothetical protein [Pyrinomonadaceae bacterium]